MSKFALSVLLFVGSFFFSSCLDTEVTTIIDLDKLGTPDLTVVNETTGETAEDVFITLRDSFLTVHPGDELGLVYVPPVVYGQYRWRVSFDLFDENFTVHSSDTLNYTVKNVPAGDYQISCTGMIEDDAAESESSRTDYLQVKVLEH